SDRSVHPRRLTGSGAQALPAALPADRYPDPLPALARSWRAYVHAGRGKHGVRGGVADDVGGCYGGIRGVDPVSRRAQEPCGEEHGGGAIAGRHLLADSHACRWSCSGTQANAGVVLQEFGMRPGAKALAGLAGALLLAAAGCMPEEESRGTWRTVSWSRPAALADTLPLSANVTYKTGHFTIRAASAPVLYTANLTFDADVQEQPSHSFDPDTRELYVGLGRGSVNMPDGAGASEGRLRLSLSRTVPLHLQTRLAGTASDLDLTGMRLERAQVMSSMSDVRVHMDEPNAAHGTVIRLDNRYGRMVAVRLANANADTITVNSDFGAVDLDFSG